GQYRFTTVDRHPSIRKITMPLVGMVIFFYPAEVVDRTRKGVGKTSVFPFGVTESSRLEGARPHRIRGAFRAGKPY
ncbi:MAG: hypothetical protein WAU28_04835, partial [Candidatus Moraniibacteriota bacterium]